MLLVAVVTSLPDLTSPLLIPPPECAQVTFTQQKEPARSRSPPEACVESGTRVFPV